MAGTVGNAAFDWRAGVVAALGLFAVTLVFSLSPIPQDPSYHRFADSRGVFGLANAGDVLSNLAFLLVGFAGLWLAPRGRAAGQPALLLCYRIFFSGVALTAFGSMYYHLAPDNARLVWDRLPMAVSFMAFFAAVIAELVSDRLGRALLGPLVAVGVASVLYWIFTEQRGAGDLRAYALVQFLPMLLIPVLLMLYPRPRGYLQYILALVACYAVSKGLEFADTEIFRMGEIVSGHTLKHLAAALAPACCRGWRGVMEKKAVASARHPKKMF